MRKIKKEDRNLNTEMKAAIYHGALFGGVVFLAGFGMMLLLSKILIYPDDLPGLFSYKAATWGDGICLPAMVFCFVTFERKNQSNLHRSPVELVSAIGSAVAGIFVQASWILSDNTILNWSIPRKHHFNFAGWWHAAFFVGMCGLTAYLFTKGWRIIRRKREPWDWIDEALFGGVISAGAVFLSLHMADDYGETHLQGYLLSGTILFLLLALGIYLKTGQADKTAYKSMSIGLLTAGAIALSICVAPVKGEFLLAIAGALCCCVIWKEEQIKRMIFMLMITIIPAFFWFYAASIMADLTESALLLLLLVVLAVVIEHFYFEGWKWHTFPLIFISLYLLFPKLTENVRLVAERLLSQQIELLNILFNIALYIVFRKEIENIFSYVIDQEDKIDHQSEIGEHGELKRVKLINYTKIVLLLCAIICILLRWFWDITANSEMAESLEVGHLNGSLWFLCGSIAGLAALYVLSNRPTTTERIGRKVLILGILIYAFLLICNISYFVQEKSMAYPVVRPQWIVLFAVTLFGWIGTVCLLSYGFKMNVTTLRRNPMTRTIREILIMLSIGDFIICGCNELLLIPYLNIISIGLAAINTIIICVLLPCICVRALHIKERQSGEIVLNTALGGVRQDGFSSAVVQIFVVGIPCGYIGIFRQNSWDTWWSLFLFMVSGMIVAEFFLRNNVEHVARQKTKAVKRDALLDEWFDLRDCIMRQSLLATLATFPYWLMFVLLEWFKYVIQTQDNNRRESFRERITKQYIDRQQFESDFEELKKRREAYRKRPVTTT